MPFIRSQQKPQVRLKSTVALKKLPKLLPLVKNTDKLKGKGLEHDTGKIQSLKKICAVLFN